MNKRHTLHFASPIGNIEIIGTDEAICSIMFTEHVTDPETIGDIPNVLTDCYTQITEYFTGERQEFTFPYVQEGTAFRKMVWDALTKIPYGETGSYKDLAASIENPKAIRAVGSANSKNKLSIVIPCHRVIGSTGKLTGYAGGLWRKEWLLQHEQSFKKEAE